MRFHKGYFIGFCILLAIEIYIALYINDTIIRPFIGDMLVVILLYFLVSAFAKANSLKIALSVLFFAYIIEGVQATPLIDLLGLSNHTLAKTVLGTTFDWKDIIAYTLGIGCIFIFERLRQLFKNQ